MKARILEFNYYENRALLEFDGDFSAVYDKYGENDINVEVKKWSAKRSGAANRYMWVLADKIARKMRITKSEVYRNAIREIGGVSETFTIRNGAVDKFCRQWESQGIGWQTEVITSDETCSDVLVYYGSSTFDREQMTQLIDNLVYDAESLGIDTDTPERQAWWQSLEEESRKH